jgi:hypothetical protein
MYFSASITTESEGMAGVGFELGTAPDLRVGVPALARAGGTAAGASVFESGRAAVESVEALWFDSGAFDSASGGVAAGEVDGATVELDEASPAAGCAVDAPVDPAGAELLGAELLGPELVEPPGGEEELSEPGLVPAP